MSLKVGIVVGEASGDQLGACLISELKKIDNDIEIEGIIGRNLIDQGCEQLYPMEKLAVMGLIEPIKRLPELYKMRKWLENYFISDPPDLFIGIDAPDFNLGLEKKLRDSGIPTVHYVSPSVWAWRQGRIKKIKKAVDLMLTLLPFEEEIYKKNSIPVKFVGHPAADRIPLHSDNNKERQELGYKENDVLIALLPGSRNSEIKNMAEVYLRAAAICTLVQPSLKFIIPVVSLEHKLEIEYIKEKYELNIDLQILEGKAYQAMLACDLALVTSGTATLELMLYKKPMIIAYKTNYITYKVVKFLLKVPFIGLPNLIANKSIVKEFIQHEAVPEKLSKEILNLLGSNNLRNEQINKFHEMHILLKQQASTQAALAIADLVGVGGK